MNRPFEDAPFDPSKAWVARSLKHAKPLTCCRISPSGRWAVAGGIDAQVHGWDLETEKKTSLPGHSGWVTAVRFSADGTTLASTDTQGGLRAWWVEDLSIVPLWEVPGAHAGWIRAIAASPDGRFFATAGNDRVVRLWSTSDGRRVKELAGHASEVFSLAFHPDGTSLASGDLMGKVRHWDVESGACRREIDASALHTRGEDFMADVGGVRSLAFDASGEKLACGGLSDAKSNTFSPGTPTILVFDWKKGAPAHRYKISSDKVDGPMNDVRFLSDGTLVGTSEALTTGAMWFWKPGDAEPFHTIAGSAGYALDLHPDGRQLAAAVFELVGRGGNGRHAKKGEYVGNAGAVRLIQLSAKPATAKKPPK